MMDASERTPSKGESPTAAQAAEQSAVSSAVTGQYQLLRDRLHQLSQSVKDEPEENDLEELEKDLEACRAHLNVIETLVREYHGEAEE